MGGIIRRLIDNPEEIAPDAAAYAIAQRIL